MFRILEFYRGSFAVNYARVTPFKQSLGPTWRIFFSTERTDPEKTTSRATVSRPKKVIIRTVISKPRKKKSKSESDRQIVPVSGDSKSKGVVPGVCGRTGSSGRSGSKRDKKITIDAKGVAQLVCDGRRSTVSPRTMESLSIRQSRWREKSRVFGRKNESKFSEYKLPLSEIRYGARAIEISNVVKYNPHFSEGHVKLKNPIKRHFTDEDAIDPKKILENASARDLVKYLKSGLSNFQDDMISKKTRKALLNGTMMPRNYLNLAQFEPISMIEGLNPELLEGCDLGVQMVVIPKDPMNEFHVRRAKVISRQLYLDYVDNASYKPRNCEFALIVGDNLTLTRDVNGKKTMVMASFVSSKVEYRRRYGLSKSTPIIRSVRSCGVDVQKARVLDGTGGLGMDAFIMASYGFQVLMVERNPILYALLYDAMQTARQVPTLEAIMNRLTLVHADTMELLPKLDYRPDVIYLDPMYPQKGSKNSLPKKAMYMARRLTGREDNTVELFDAAMRYSDVVVLKRPIYFPISHNCTTSFSSKLVRFEVYKTATTSANE